MKKLIIMILSLLIALVSVGLLEAAEVTINGAGATFPYPLYSQWAYKYNSLTGLKLNYQSIGSGGGIAQIKAKTVDFGASDAPMKAEELDQLGLLQFPMTIGGVVPVINVPGISAGKLKLTPAILADIYLGKITKWNDPAIAKINSGAKLPDLAITVVHRADGSGTTWIFTNYLSKISQEWKDKVGNDKAVSWPVGIGGKGNEGVAANVQQVNGSIGYVEYAYAVQNKMAYISFQNKDGAFVMPSIKSFQAACSGADWKNAPGMFVVLTDQSGKDSWPITGASFILIYKNQQEAEKSKAMLKFFDWCLRNGADIAKSLDYVPIPPNVIELVELKWKRDVKVGDKPLWP